MRSIRIERYSEPQAIGYSGLIEGVTDDGASWIIFLDEVGRPAEYWPEREPDGAVTGESISLMSYIPRASGPEVPDLL